FFYSFFHRVTPNVMGSDLMREFAVGGALLGTLSAFYFYPYTALQVPLGVMLDRFGARRVLALAALTCAIGTVLFASAHTLTTAYIGRAMIGAGSAFAWIGTLALISAWFPPKRFALVAGLTAMIGMTGAVGGLAPLAALTEMFGWRPTMLAASVYGVVLAAGFWWIIRTPPGVSGSDNRGKAPDTTIWANLGRLASTPQVWCNAMVVTMGSVPLLTFASLWGVPYLVSVYGMNRTAAAASLSLILVGWALGAPVIGWISDRFQRRKAPILVGAAVASGAFLGINYFPGLGLPALNALLFLHGFAGASLVVAYAAGRENAGRAVSGAAMGFINMWAMGTSALLQTFIGWLLDLNWDGQSMDGARIYSPAAYDAAFLTYVATAALLVGAAALMRETHCRVSE
ncbi:MAG: MFS transporter, partial [Rhodospirillales bacterium]|nr:MFS transporter [Rhodospirillales bacterium]